MQVIDTACGKLKGLELSGRYAGVTEFHSVPYAMPPVGALRWAPPAELKPWNGVRDCTAFPKIAPQQVWDDKDVYVDDFWFDGVPEMGEDCLYMDIYTAGRPGEKRPVYMWFHGGALNTGWSYEHEFNGAELARKGAVVVSVATRLNAFGYLSLPQLSEEQGGYSGNYGLMDEHMALKWVLANIAQFGGDPERVTVGGESGGTFKATALAFSPVTKGHIRGCILQSGVKWNLSYYTQAENDANSREYLEACGVDPDASLEELRALPYEVLLKARREGEKMLSLGNIFDGELIPCRTVPECMSLYGEGVDMLCGVNLGEAMVDIANAGVAITAECGGEDLSTAKGFYQLYRRVLGDELFRKYDFERLVRVTDENAAVTARVLATLGLCEPAYFNYSRNLTISRMCAETMKKRYPNNSYYVYLFAHMLPYSAEDKGTYRDPEELMCYHGSELYFTFGSLFCTKVPGRQWRSEDYAKADEMSSMWFRFISAGNPNGEGPAVWLEAGHGDYIVFGAGHERLEIRSEKLEALLREFVAGNHYSFVI